MKILLPILVISFAGGIGGLLNALLKDKAIILPGFYTVDGNKIIRLGVFGNILIGAIAAAVSWGLYGPFNGYVLLGTSVDALSNISVTLASVMGAILVGIGGARVLTNEFDNRILKTAVETSISKSNPDKLKDIEMATPIEVLEIVSDL